MNTQTNASDDDCGGAIAATKDEIKKAIQVVAGGIGK